MWAWNLTPYLVFLGLGVDVSQMQENLERLVVLHSSLEDLSQGLLRAVHVFQVQQGHPHVQLLLLLSEGVGRTRVHQLCAGCPRTISFSQATTVSSRPLVSTETESVPCGFPEGEPVFPCLPLPSLGLP
ncbi:mCG148484 [Mus musculus]|uniref:Uncharacterized protein n=1 Tax=Mus musculus TaxID=10090 RepID=Q8C3B4_MOUSE|nr:mCG148484 [Mus musculus]BAC39666.1 unnamed protein product [Mus musculus]